MAANAANAVNVWTPPGSVSNIGLQDPNYNRGWNTQTYYYVGTAGAAATYDTKAPDKSEKDEK